VNGEWCGQSHALLTDVLREEWGFEGFVISDWIFGLRDAATSVTPASTSRCPTAWCAPRPARARSSG
jgi:hypothetical protein